MKYFVSNVYDGCWYYRCYLPMLFNGFSGDKESFSSKKDHKRDAFMATRADTVIFHRPDEEVRLLVAIKLKEAGKKIVFDNDDTYKDCDQMRLHNLDKKIEILDLFIHKADLITTTTEFLADEYRKLNKNVVVLKNYINPNDFPEPKRNNTNKIRIGIFGSATMNSDSSVIEDVLIELNKRKDVQLVMFGLPPKNNTAIIEKTYKDDRKFWSKFNIEWQPFVEMKDYFKTLNNLKLDFCLIPRQDNYFNRCKSNIKFLEASMLEIPCIAQGFEDGKSPYQGEEDSKYMLIAKNKWEWLEHIKRLINSKEDRENLGKYSHEYVLKNYNIADHYQEWNQAYKKIC